VLLCCCGAAAVARVLQLNPGTGSGLQQPVIIPASGVAVHAHSMVAAARRSIGTNAGALRSSAGTLCRACGKLSWGLPVAPRGGWPPARLRLTTAGLCVGSRCRQGRACAACASGMAARGAVANQGLIRGPCFTAVCGIMLLCSMRACRVCVFLLGGCVVRVAVLPRATVCCAPARVRCPCCLFVWCPSRTWLKPRRLEPCFKSSHTGVLF
jgi:hypothetical protein